MAQPRPDAGVSDTALELFELESQFEQLVASSTKQAQRSAVAPAVIVVVTGEEMRALGLTTLAEVLRTVPGFYDVSDHVLHNLGVRGINGGARAGGGLIKLMIDGMPVDFRPTNGLLIDEELIPLTAVKRVEIIRGPASALYGANAFLGVVNVMTVDRSERPSATLQTRGGFVRQNLQGGASLTLNGGEGDVDVLVGGHLAYANRAGLSAPPSSPMASDARFAGTTRTDITRPKSLVARVSLNQLLGGKLTLLGSMQAVDAQGPFLDFGPMSPFTRVALLNESARLQYERTSEEGLRLTGSVGVARSQSLPEQRLDIGQADYFLQSTAKSEAFTSAAEVSGLIGSLFSLTGGLDYLFDRQATQTFSRISRFGVVDGTFVRPAGTVTPGEGAGISQTFHNLGGYVQGIFTPEGPWSFTSGLRLDWHNIYGLNPSGRGAVVLAPADKNFSVKLLYGSSFKAPSGVQLYTQPMFAFDLRGNASLRAQTAHTIELAFATSLFERLELSANVFATGVFNRVEFLQEGYYLRATNTSEQWLLGAELDARAKIVGGLSAQLNATFARTVAETTRLLTEVDKNPLFPPYQVHLLADYRFGVLGLRATFEVSLVGPRGASQQNSILAGGAYTLPPLVFKVLESRERELRGARSPLQQPCGS